MAELTQEDKKIVSGIFDNEEDRLMAIEIMLENRLALERKRILDGITFDDIRDIIHFDNGKSEEEQTTAILTLIKKVVDLK